MKFDLQNRTAIFVLGFVAGAAVCGIIAALIAGGAFSADEDPVMTLEEMVAHIKGDQVAEVNMSGDDIRLTYWTGKRARVEDSRNASVALVMEAMPGTKTRIAEAPTTPGIFWLLIGNILPLLMAGLILAGAAAAAGYAFGRGVKKS